MSNFVEHMSKVKKSKKVKSKKLSDEELLLKIEYLNDEIDRLNKENEDIRVNVVKSSIMNSVWTKHNRNSINYLDSLKEKIKIAKEKQESLLETKSELDSKLNDFYESDELMKQIKISEEIRKSSHLRLEMLEERLIMFKQILDNIKKKNAEEKLFHKVFYDIYMDNPQEIKTIISSRKNNILNTVFQESLEEITSQLNKLEEKKGRKSQSNNNDLTTHNIQIIELYSEKETLLNKINLINNLTDRINELFENDEIGMHYLLYEIESKLIKIK